jgi:putative transposase
MSAPDRYSLVDRDQARHSAIGRLPSGACGQRRRHLALMWRIDELFTTLPFLGSRQMTAMLRGHAVNRKGVRKVAWCRDRAAEPRVVRRPHLHCDLRGFLYVVAIMDWASWAVLSWRLSNTIDVSFCLCALEDALARFRRPEIFNTDQGCQFTSSAFTNALTAAGVRITMDGSAAGWTTRSSSGCGARSSTRTSTKAMPTAVTRTAVSANGSDFITTRAHIRRLAARR